MKHYFKTFVNIVKINYNGKRDDIRMCSKNTLRN